MRRSRAIVAYGIAAALMTTGVAACGDDAKDAGELDVWIAFTDYKLDWAKDRAAEFEKAHPDYKINITGFDTYEVLWDKLTQASEQGEAPTIVQNFEAATQESRDAVNADGEPLFKPVEDAIDGRDAILDEPVVLDDIVDSAKNYYTVDGKFSSMPWNTSTPIFYSNRALLDKAGIDEPPVTWEDLEADCKKIMALDDAPKKCVSWPNHAWFPEQVLAEQGGLLADHSNGRDGRAENIDLTSPEFMEWIEYWKKLNDEGYYYYSGKQEDWDGPKNAFGAQEVAFLNSSSGDATPVVGDAKDAGFDVDVSKMPVLEGKDYVGNIIGGATLWLTDGLEKKTEDGALAFMQYLNNPDNAADWHKQTGYVPITNAAVDKLTEEGWFDENPYQMVATEQLEGSASDPAAAGALVGNFVAIRAEVTQAAEDIITSGVDPAERMAEAQEKAQQLLDDYNDLYVG